MSLKAETGQGETCPDSALPSIRPKAQLPRSHSGPPGEHRRQQDARILLQVPCAWHSETAEDQEVAQPLARFPVTGVPSIHLSHRLPSAECKDANQSAKTIQGYSRKDRRKRN